jgi:hypothetical protein
MLAERYGVPLRTAAVVDGEDAVERTLTSAITAPDVTVVVVGARAHPGPGRRVGHLARAVAIGSRAPVVVVPPDAADASHRARGVDAATGLAPVRRALVPLETAELAAGVVVDWIERLQAEGVEVVAVHVFAGADRPPIVDRPVRDLQLVGDEFLARSLPGAAVADIDLRAGAVGAGILHAAAEAATDLVVLCWSQDTSPGRAAVVRDVLRYATVPVLLLPAGGARVGGEGAAPRDEVALRGAR